MEKLQGLGAVFQELHTDKVKLYGSKTSKSFLYFDEAFDIFMGYQVRKGRGSQTQADKTEFMTDLLHDRHGLAMSTVKMKVLNRRIILLRPG